MIRNGICYMTIDISSATFNANGTAMLKEGLPAEIIPKRTVNMPISVYGFNGNLSYNVTQAWIRVDGNLSIVSGIVNNTVGECHAFIGYPL